MEFTRRQFLWQVSAAPLEMRLLRQAWSAKWISAPGAPRTEYGVYHFRKSLELAEVPAHFVVHASGDNRYQLFVNGRRVLSGPARGDLFHWRYETVDVAPYLQSGRNVFAALLWNFGELAPEAQITLQTGFLLQGDTAAERAVDTGASWKSWRNPAYSPLLFTNGQMRGYYVAGPGDRVAAAQYPWGWENVEFDDSRWPSAVVVEIAAGREASDPHTRWMLVPRPIPLEEERPERLQKVRRASGIEKPVAFPAQSEPLHVPPNTHATLLLDQQYLTTAYPELQVSGGRNSMVRLHYAESLFQPNREKGNRDEVEGKEFVGNYDEFVADGGPRRVFRPLWWRTYRYLELEIETKAEALTVDDLRATAVSFPFQRRARFESDAPDLQRILDVGWRTARLCAHETYMDCPYYEQLQYVGDTRVQSLVSLFNAGDGRLMRNAIDQINDSRRSDGSTMSRYPTRLEQYIPGFSLWWIGMVHDYWRYVDDSAFVHRMLPGVRAVLSFFESYQKENGSLGPLPWWRYFDWVPSWQGGDPPQEPDGSSAPFDLLLLMAYRWASELEAAQGVRALADLYGTRERQLRETAGKLYWDSGRRLYADTPRRQQFSQHTNTMAVLSDVIAGEPARDLMLRCLSAPGLAEPGLFFRYYEHVALAKVGEGDSYLDRLGDWRDMLARGLTTFAEVVDRPGNPSRSDCHAWSASPNIEILRTVLGVDSAAPGFRRVSVRPHLGKLEIRRRIGPASQRQRRSEHRAGRRHRHSARGNHRRIRVARRAARTLPGRPSNRVMIPQMARLRTLALLIPIALLAQNHQTFRIKPVRPVAELRAAALAEQPPREQGEFRKADLVDLASSILASNSKSATPPATIFLARPSIRRPAFLQRPAAEAMLRAHRELLKQGYGLLIFDAYRPWYITKIFWDATPPDKHDFVADPSKGSRHNRGCAVDLTLYDLKTGKEIEMTGGYDEMSERSYPNYTGGTPEQRAHRDLLRRAMEAQGFQVYDFEWWHFDYRDWPHYAIQNVRFEDIR